MGAREGRMLETRLHGGRRSRAGQEGSASSRDAALTARYRPHRFGELIGQQDSVALLRTYVGQASSPPTLLLCGPPGTGKTSAARILRAAMNCLDLVAGEPCGACVWCVDDIFSGYEIDGASNGRVQDIRVLKDMVRTTSPADHFSVVIDEAHQVSPEAFDALLKLLEEPPPGVYFVLVSSAEEKLPPAIRSRATTCRFERVADRSIAEHVRRVATDEGVDVDDDVVGRLVETARGSVRDALKELDAFARSGRVPRVDGMDDSAETSRALSAAAEGDLRAWGNAIEELASNADGRSALDSLSKAFDGWSHDRYESRDRLPVPAVQAVMSALGDARRQLVAGEPGLAVLRMAFGDLSAALMGADVTPPSDRASSDDPEWWVARRCPTPRSSGRKMSVGPIAVTDKPCTRSDCPVCRVRRAEGIARALRDRAWTATVAVGAPIQPLGEDATELSRRLWNRVKRVAADLRDVWWAATAHLDGDDAAVVTLLVGGADISIDAFAAAASRQGFDTLSLASPLDVADPGALLLGDLCSAWSMSCEDAKTVVAQDAVLNGGKLVHVSGVTLSDLCGGPVP